MITIQLNIEEVNTILSALGHQPYIQVYELIQKIREQAEQQIKASAVKASETEGMPEYPKKSNS